MCVSEKENKKTFLISTPDPLSYPLYSNAENPNFLILVLVNHNSVAMDGYERAGEGI